MQVHKIYIIKILMLILILKTDCLPGTDFLTLIF